jgi:transposase
MAPIEILIKKFQLEIEFLGAENASLKRRIAELEDRLKLNSKNSSIPSSKELYKIKQEKKVKSQRNIGAQPGHKGYGPQKLEADKIIKVDLAETCECGGKISLSLNPYIHQKIDLPEIKPYVVEYQLAHGRCGKCGKRKSSRVLEGVNNDRFGPRIKTVIGALTGFYKNSKREVEDILKSIFKVPISLGSISNSEARIAAECKEQYEDIELNLSYSKLLYIDETSHYNKGKLGWCWLFADSKYSLIKLEDSRSKKILENSVFGSDDNIIVSDRYGAYNYFTRENRQVCWSHLARDFSRFAHSSYHEIRTIGNFLEGVARELFALKTALAKDELSELYFLRRSRKLRRRTWHYLRDIAWQSEATQASRVAKNIMKSEDMMWRFLENPKEIPLTNNHAEQQIRHYVVYRKNSYFTQSERGNRFLERCIS